MAELKIFGTNFNKEWAGSVTEKEFLEVFSKSIMQDLPEKERTEKLKEAYKQLRGETEKPEAKK